MNTKELFNPITPGEILREDFMEPMGLSINRLALHGGGFDWLRSEDEDIYSIEDGEVVTWGDA